METSNILAIDIGASSGRCILGSFDGTKVELTEIHRFVNGPVKISGTLYWDILHILQEIKEGIAKVNVPLQSIGVDTWGVDFGLLDKTGQLLGNPVNYRDERTSGIPEKFYEKMSEQDLYEKSGIQPMKINTIFQLYAMLEKNPDILTLVDKILFMPDLINYFLTGIKATEYSIASTSALLEAREKSWNKEIMEVAGFKEAWFVSALTSSGSVLGDLLPEFFENNSNPLPKVVVTASHDTAAAIAATPLEKKNAAYISCGTWSLVGLETTVPIINDYTYKKGITNERGVNNTVRLLKNLTGLWVLQECKRYWETKGVIFDYSAMVKTAEQVESGGCFIDLNDPVFLAPGNMRQRIQDFCKDTQQKVPESKAEVIRCILDSLACHYKSAIDELEEALGDVIPQIHIVGGGARNALLCQITANVTHKTVLAGPVEASAMGNMLVQLKALGKINTMDELRTMVRASTVIEAYHPQAGSHWEEIYQNFRLIAK